MCCYFSTVSAVAGGRRERVLRVEVVWHSGLSWVNKEKGAIVERSIWLVAVHPQGCKHFWFFFGCLYHAPDCFGNSHFHICILQRDVLKFSFSFVFMRDKYDWGFHEFTLRLYRKCTVRSDLPCYSISFFLYFNL